MVNYNGSPVELPVDTVGLQTVYFENNLNILNNGKLRLQKNNNYVGKIDNIVVKYAYKQSPSIPLSHIIEYDSKTKSITPVLVDGIGNVLNFSENNFITGINVIDDLLLWTDNTNEPKKISISRCKVGTIPDGTTHTRLIVGDTVASNLIEEEHITVIKKSPSRAPIIDTKTNIREGYIAGNMKKRPYFYPPGENAAGENYALVEIDHEMWVGLPNDGVDQPELFVGDIISVYNGYDNHEDEDVPVARLLIKEVKNPLSANFNFTQIQNNFGTNIGNWDVYNGFISGGTSAGPAIANQVAYRVAVLSIIDHQPVKGIGPVLSELKAEYFFKLDFLIDISMKIMNILRLDLFQK